MEGLGDKFDPATAPPDPRNLWRIPHETQLGDKITWHQKDNGKGHLVWTSESTYIPLKKPNDPVINPKRSISDVLREDRERYQKANDQFLQDLPRIRELMGFVSK